MAGKMKPKKAPKGMPMPPKGMPMGKKMGKGKMPKGMMPKGEY